MELRALRKQGIQPRWFYPGDIVRVINMKMPDGSPVTGEWEVTDRHDDKLYLRQGELEIKSPEWALEPA
jgi:hypothetical protein